MNLSTTYMGLSLKNPLVPSASPLSQELDTIKKLEDAGAGAIVMYSIFEEQFQLESKALDHYLSHGAESFSEALSYFPTQNDYKRGPEEYLSHIQKIKKSVSIPVIPSINCISTSGWVEYAKKKSNRQKQMHWSLIYILYLQTLILQATPLKSFISMF